MAPIAVGKFAPGSPEWLEARRTRLGGSEIASVLGLSPWKSSFTLWHEKAGMEPEFTGNERTEWGQRLEPVVGAKFMENHPELVSMPDQGYTYQSAERPWQSASPDVYFDGTFLEVKTAGRADAWYDGIPPNYLCQVLWTMDVLEVQTAHLAVLIGGNDYREFVIDLDDDAKADLAVMRAAGEAFMASLESGTPPDIDDSYGTYQTVRRTHPDIDIATEYEVDRDLAEAFVNAQTTKNAADKAAQLARTDIARHMGTAHYAVCDGVRIARRQPARDGGPPVLVTTRKTLPPISQEGEAA